MRTKAMKSINVFKNKLSFVKTEVYVYIALMVILLIAQIISPNYLNPDHVLTILRLASFVGIASIGQTFAILIGGFDLSIPFVITFANVVSSQIMFGSDENLPMAILVVIIMGALIGAFNAFGIAILKIPPFIMTLGSGTVIQGLYMIYSKGAPKGNSAPLLRTLCSNILFNKISGILILWFILSVIVILLLKCTPYGRKIYAVGTNAQAANFSGIRVKSIVFSVYIISGILAAITGLLFVGLTGTSYLNIGTRYATIILASVVIGGTAITGGKGGYVGTIAGAIIMTVLDDLLSIVNISQGGRLVFQGVIILLLVFSYSRRSEN